MDMGAGISSWSQETAQILPTELDYRIYEYLNSALDALFYRYLASNTL